MTRVALASTKNRGEGVRRATDLLAVKSFHGKSVVLKPNFNTARICPMIVPKPPTRRR